MCRAVKCGSCMCGLPGLGVDVTLIIDCVGVSDASLCTCLHVLCDAAGSWYPCESNEASVQCGAQLPIDLV